MTASKWKTIIIENSAFHAAVLLLTAALMGGCASSGSRPDLQRSDSEAAMHTLQCPGNQKPTCIRRSGTLGECSCATNYDFRKLWKANL